MPIPMNPYIVGDPVGHTDVFVGRKDILNEVRNNLHNPGKNIFLLYGQRRVGKTSILQYLEKNLETEELFHSVYFDLHGKSELTLPEILQQLGVTIAHKLNLPDPHTQLQWNSEQVFRKTWLPGILNTLPEGCSLILLFDEFDVLADPSHQPSDSNVLSTSHLFKYFKALATDYAKKIKLIFVIGRNKEDLSLIAQPLFKDSKPCLVSLLCPNDVITLIRLSEKNNTLRWTDTAIGQVIQLTNGHPLFTQELCSQIWYLAYDQNPDQIPTATYEDVNAVVPRVLDRIEHHLELFWGSWGTAEMVAAAVLAEAGPEPVTQEQLENLLLEKSQLRFEIREVQDASRRLTERDVLEFTEDGQFRFRVELVRQWIALYKKPDDLLQREVDKSESLAENFYRTALRLYEEGELEEALDQVRKAFERNPYHPRINQLWADILIDRKKLTEARELLEQFYEYQPSAAGAKLIKVYLLLAEGTEGDEKKRELYGRVLKINPSQPEARRKWQESWKFAAEVSAKIAISSGKLEDLEAAYEAYREAGAQEKAHEFELKIQARAIIEGKQQLDSLEITKDYQRALTLLNVLEQKYPAAVWGDYRKRLSPKADLAKRYQEALDVLDCNRELAQTLLIQVITQDPKYEDATLYLHQAVKGENFSGLLQRLAESQGQCTQIEAEVQKLRIEAEQAYANSTYLEESLARANDEIQRMKSALEQAEEQAQHEAAVYRQQIEGTNILQKDITSLRERYRDLEQKIRDKDDTVRQQLQELEDYRQLEMEWGTKFQDLELAQKDMHQSIERQETRNAQLQSRNKEETDRQTKLLKEIAKVHKNELIRYRVALAIIVVLSFLYVGYTLLVN